MTTNITHLKIKPSLPSFKIFPLFVSKIRPLRLKENMYISIEHYNNQPVSKQAIHGYKFYTFSTKG